MAAPFSVLIIESPSASDLFHSRSEGPILCKTLDLANVPFSYYLAVNKNTFFTALGASTVLLAHQTGPPPTVLHISAHGDHQGFALTSGEVITWAEIKPLLAFLNTAMQGRLLLCMSSCQGMYAGLVAMARDDPPMYALVGSPTKPTWTESAVGYATLYHLLNKEKTLADAVTGMKVASGNDSFGILRGDDIRDIYVDALRTLDQRAMEAALKQRA